MQKTAGEGPANFLAWLSLGPMSDLILPSVPYTCLCTKYSVCQYYQDGDKKFGYLMLKQGPSKLPWVLTLFSHPSSPRLAVTCNHPSSGKFPISKHPPMHMFPPGPKYHLGEGFKFQLEGLAP